MPYYYAISAQAGKTSDGSDKGVGPGVLTCTVCRARPAHGGNLTPWAAIRRSLRPVSCVAETCNICLSATFFLLQPCIRVNSGGARRSSLHEILGMQHIPTR